MGEEEEEGGFYGKEKKMKSRGTYHLNNGVVLIF